MAVAVRPTLHDFLQVAKRELGFRDAKIRSGFGPEYDRGGPMTVSPGRGAPIGPEVTVLLDAKRGYPLGRRRRRRRRKTPT
jgi:hypothetical protein